MILSLFAVSFFGLCIYAALIDIETLTIPNWLNGWLAFLFIPAAILAAPGWEVVGWHLLVGAIAFVASVALFFLGVYGGGDAKFVPGVLLWVGERHTLEGCQEGTARNVANTTIVASCRKRMKSH